MEDISCTASCDVDKKDLEELFEVLGSGFSLEDISSAFVSANFDKNLAGETLCGIHGSNSTTANTGKSEAENAVSMKLASGRDSMRPMFSELSPKVFKMAPIGEKDTREFKSKRYPVSMGAVSSVLGKEYAKPKPLTHRSVEATKPLKLDSKDFPVSDVWREKNPPSMVARHGIMQAGVEEFLFQMLGNGFQLDMTLIQEVLGRCGYDIQKSIDELLELSASTLEKSDDAVSMAMEESTKQCSDQESLSLQEQTQQLRGTQSDGARLHKENLTGSLKREHNRVSLEREILQSLFDLPERSEEAPKKTRLVRQARSVFGKPAVTPHKDTAKEHKPSAAKPLADTRGEAEGDENSYEVLRKAVKEYWITKKEFYKAAADAFAEGDHARADKLMDQGQFFNEKAREADEKSFQKLMETRDDEIVSLDLLGFEPKEALHSLRFHLTSFSGIPSIKYLRVVIENDEKDTTKGKRRRLIMKQLEKESIKWTDEGNGQIILIQVDAIDPKHLSFAEKYMFRSSQPKSGIIGYQVSQQLV
ncbi:hypothetical protein POPTR_001G401900v4 [Populus trichocarpa]|uniref:DUF1771 domain-containing protein n=1 Tax=Populus trichocarpa TaxID=3694 RepID=A0A3N7FFJ4_POPTR|nr:putative nuclear RNA export factor SDE5 isoform X1 [Populus trichocarpa]RQO85971.1 hypothetical protein POPTR_001G401900v4 [Populus trichocarpa]|eukprot:XP_024466524.1 putative nuclear RNA export factor SDE5 isoform X1 [Populus trichocarpa]